MASFDVSTFQDNKWQPYGTLSTESYSVIDKNNRPCFIYDSQRLIGVNGASICPVNSDGYIFDKKGVTIGYIKNYKDFLQQVNSGYYYKGSEPLLNSQVRLIRNIANNSADSALLQYVDLIQDSQRFYHDAGQYIRYLVDYSNPVYMLVYTCQLLAEADVDLHVKGYEYLTEEYTNKLRDVISISERINQPSGLDKIANSQKEIAYYLLAQYYEDKNDYSSVVNFLNNVSCVYHPYKACMMYYIQQTQETESLLKKAVLSQYWENRYQKAATWFMLFDYHINNTNDVNYAYECVRFASEIDPESESFRECLRNFRRDSNGIIHYIG